MIALLIQAIPVIVTAIVTIVGLFHPQAVSNHPEVATTIAGLGAVAMHHFTAPWKKNG